MRGILIASFLLILAIPSRGADWALEIVPTDLTERGAAIGSYDLTPEFHVILTNISGRKLNVWKEWCSAGWYNLSFEVQRADGTKFNLHKSTRGWSWNSPDPYLVLPHRSFVYSVSLNEDWGPNKVWTGFPSVFYQEPVKLTAVFEEHRDPDFESDFESFEKSTVPEIRQHYLLVSQDLWIGQVKSAPLLVMLEKPQKPHN